MLFPYRGLIFIVPLSVYLGSGCFVFEFRVLHFRVQSNSFSSWDASFSSSGSVFLFEFRVLHFRVQCSSFSSWDALFSSLACFVSESGCFVFEVRVFLFRIQGRLLGRVGSLRASVFVYDFLVFKTTIRNITV